MKTPDTSPTQSPTEAAFQLVFPDSKIMFSDFDKLVVIYHMVDIKRELVATLYSTLIGANEDPVDKTAEVKKYVLNMQTQMKPANKDLISVKDTPATTPGSDPTEASTSFPVRKANGEGKGRKGPKRTKPKHDYPSTSASARRYRVGVIPSKDLINRT